VRRLLAGFALAAAFSVSGCGNASAGRAHPPPPKAVPALRILSERIDGRTWLTPLSARAAAAGAGPLKVLGADIAAEGDRIGAFVAIPEGECALAFARPTPTILDVDLFAYDDDGSAFATDESPESEASILICPPHPRRLYVVARVMTGSGILSVGVQSVPRAAADAVAMTVGVRGLPGQDTGRLDAWPGLEAKIRAHRRTIGARWDDVRRIAVPLSPRAPTRISAAIDPGRCIDALVSPSEEISSFELVAEDATGRIIGRGRDHGRDRSLVLCSAAAAQITLAIRPRSTQGLAAVTIGRTAVGAELEIAGGVRVVHVTQTLDLDAARRELNRSLVGSGYAAPKSIASGAARIGSRVTVPIDLPQGCARIDVLAGKPLSGVTASLWDDKGALLAEARGGASASLFPCGRGGAARLDLEAMESPGPFAVELRKDTAAPPLLVSHRAAAARLLARLTAGGDPRGAAAAASAVLVLLDSASLKSAPLPVAGDGCVEVIVALEGGGSGIDLRLVDGATGEGTITRSRFVAADRLCAAPSSKPGAYEIRLGAGKAEALVLARVVSGP
jgi:hypothetical protein